MSTINETLNENQKYAQAFQLGHLAMPPARKLAIVACMDARMTVEQFLGLKTGDAHIIRNAGGLVTEDALRSLIISYHLLGTREFMIINHTDCGMLTFNDAALKEQLYTSTHAYSAVPAAFHAFGDVEKNVREQIAKVKSHPWIPKEVPVRGFVYDVKSGRLKEVN
jgi:carbonic anhydrase